MTWNVIVTSQFETWARNLRDSRARAAIALRNARAEAGNLGDRKSLGRGLWEMRITVGPGYRVYYCVRPERTFLLLIGGDKSSQSSDIQLARKLKSEL